jgi:outer membrane protein assembly factor BamB
MHRLPSAIIFALVIAFTLEAGEPKDDRINVAPTDWPWWRGPNRNGVADAKQKPPVKWSETENVLWKVPVPGKGHGSPIIVGDHVYLATANHKDETQSVLCYDRKEGKLLWDKEVHRGGFDKGGNGKSTLASGTTACDGHRVFVNFLHDKAIYTTALSVDGKQLWQTKITDYTLHQGFASSPAVYESLVIVSADNKGTKEKATGVIAGLERATGKIVWKIERPKLPNYASPIIIKVAGREQLFLTGCNLVTSLDPLTGVKNWETKGSTEETVTSTVTNGDLIITSGGYPKNHVAALKADGSLKTVWENGAKVYVPSMIERNGYLYAVQDEGVAVCWKFDTGKEAWKNRLGGKFSASPVLVGDHLYAFNETGRTFIYKANPDAFDLVAENQLGDEVMATPAICGSRIYIRLAIRQNGERQEMLYCIGAK